jgi:hypothetical protein
VLERTSPESAKAWRKRIGTYATQSVWIIPRFSNHKLFTFTGFTKAESRANDLCKREWNTGVHQSLYIDGDQQDDFDIWEPGQWTISTDAHLPGFPPPIFEEPGTLPEFVERMLDIVRTRAGSFSRQEQA